jgi:hypothetical protein
MYVERLVGAANFAVEARLRSRGDYPLLEAEARFERPARRAGFSDALKPPPLVGREVVGKVNVDRDAMRDALGVVVNFDGWITDVPASVLRIHRDHRGKELVRCGPLICAAEALGLVGDDDVAAVHVDLVLERVAHPARSRGHAHQRAPMP